ncbi:hypothetical protein C2G38_2166998 [Gigaspora rosea]|uniref:Uncharacterized protein n=1 Tax=Gigaspora rosea TaxID=44941 RepID=A0A397VSW6_9GLOM|nr:hypothetical protein C2G38_2166998 [Gigaspora rosea]
MPTKNLGPCLIIGCMNTNVQFRTITVLAYEKCQRKQTLEAYPYLENTFASNIDMLTKALYFQQRRECTNLELDLVNFERMIETINPGLKGFFNSMTEAIIPKECSAYTLYMRTLPALRSSFPQQIESFLPILGPLHISLNSREQPRPWRVNLLLELTRNGWSKIKDKIIEKFGRACKDIEYQAVVDLLDNLVPATLDNHLTCFNEYYVENVHSKIRANTSKNASVDSIIKQAYFIMNHDPIFKNTYCKTRRYPYTKKTLDFLYNKTALFHVQHFQSIFYNRGKSIPRPNKDKKKKLPTTYYLSTLEKDVDLRHLPTAYSTAHPPRPGLCDSCGRIFKNVQKFLNRIEKGADTLTKEDLDDDDDDVENVEEESEEIEEVDISPKLIEEMNQIEHW